MSYTLQFIDLLYPLKLQNGAPARTLLIAGPLGIVSRLNLFSLSTLGVMKDMEVPERV